MITLIKYIINNMLKLKLWLGSTKEIRHFMNRVLWEKGYPWTKLSPTPLKNIFPNIDNSKYKIIIKDPFNRCRGSSIELDELIVILEIAKYTNANKIIEVGTFNGNTAMNFALNVSASGKVVTLDLPPEGPDRLSKKKGRGVLAEFNKCQNFDDLHRKKITQVYGDSAKIDWTSLGGSFDLAFIDGDHSSHYVLSDTRNILSVLKPDGIVIWHDYEYKSVSSIIDKAVERGQSCYWIKGTRLAVARFKDPATSAKNFFY